MPEMTERMTRCRDCDGVISRMAHACPHCGRPRMPARTWIVTLVALAVVVGIAAAIMLTTIH